MRRRVELLTSCRRSGRHLALVSWNRTAIWRGLVVGADDLVEHLALLLAAIAAVQRFGLHLLAVDLDMAGTDEAFLLAERVRDRLVVALAAIVAVELFAREQAVAAHGQRRLVGLGIGAARAYRGRG